MKVKRLRELITHAEHMVRVRPDGPDKEVAKALVTFGKDYLTRIDEQKIPFLDSPSAFYEMRSMVLSEQEGYDLIRDLNGLFDKSGIVTVAELYTLINIPPTFLDEKWGWVTKFNNRQLHRVDEGLQFKPPMPRLIKES